MERLLKVLISNPHEFTYKMAADAVDIIMSNKATPAQIGAFLVALKLTNKENDPKVIASIAEILRTKSVCLPPIQLPKSSTAASSDEGEVLIDIVGTGGDGQNTFNVSTASGIVVAGAGCFVAKVSQQYILKLQNNRIWKF